MCYWRHKLLSSKFLSVQGPWTEVSQTYWPANMLPHYHAASLSDSSIMLARDWMLTVDQAILQLYHRGQTSGWQHVLFPTLFMTHNHPGAPLLTPRHPCWQAARDWAISTHDGEICGWDTPEYTNTNVTINSTLNNSHYSFQKLLQTLWKCPGNSVETSWKLTDRISPIPPAHCKIGVIDWVISMRHLANCVPPNPTGHKEPKLLISIMDTLTLFEWRDN